MLEPQTPHVASPIVAGFLERTREERPPLARILGGLDEPGMRELSRVLSRFVVRPAQVLDGDQRERAFRVLERLREPSSESLRLLNEVLDYLDIKPGARLDSRETELCLQVLEVFARSQSDEDALTVRELELLKAVLRHFDVDDNRRLGGPEVRWLRFELTNPSHFMERQRRENPRFRMLLDG